MPVDTTETELALAALDDEILELTKKRKKLERTLRFQQREVVSITVSGCGPNVDGEYFRPKRPYDEAILFSRRAGVGTENTHIFKELLCGFYIGERGRVCHGIVSIDRQLPQHAHRRPGLRLGLFPI